MIDLLIPVLGRPWNVQPLLESIVENTAGSYRVIFICSPGDQAQIDACRKSAYDTFIVEWEPGRADYAKKINWGFENSWGEWVFSGADDIRFRKGWDALALRYGKRHSVIGTNDLHNPSVKKGMHSTHILFRREYIEKQGGTFDGSGKVFSERYDHQWVDNEFIQTAQKRRQWRFARQSVVEHFHPIWKNAEWDSTYEKSFREAKQDRELFARRIRQMERVPKR